MGPVALPLLVGATGSAAAGAVQQVSAQAFEISAPITSAGPQSNSAPADAPVGGYSIVFGGISDDIAGAIAVDSSGSAYVTGLTSPPLPPNPDSFPTTTGIFQDANHDGQDVFVSKLTPGGRDFDCSTYFGGSGDEFGSAIAVDADGLAYVTGSTSSPDFPGGIGIPAPKIGPGPLGNHDAFVAVVDKDGTNLLYSLYIGGSGSTSGRGIRVDDKHMAYVTGTTSSSDFPQGGVEYPAVPPPAPKIGPGSRGGNKTDVFLVKLNTTPWNMPGSHRFLDYSLTIGGGSASTGNAITVDAQGNAYLTGNTHAANFPGRDSLGAAKAEERDSKPVDKIGFGDQCGGSNGDIFLVKLDTMSPPPRLVYSVCIGAARGSTGNAIAVDSKGNAYVTGPTNTTNFPGRGSTGTPASQGSGSRKTFLADKYGSGLRGGGFRATNDIFVVKLDTTVSMPLMPPTLAYSVYIGGSDTDIATGIAADDQGHAYVTGFTSSPDFPGTGSLFGEGNATPACKIGSGPHGNSTYLQEDIFVVKLDTSLDQGRFRDPSLLYSNYIGGSFDDEGRGIVVDNQGQAYVTGVTASFEDFPGGDRIGPPTQGALANSRDVFVVKLTARGFIIDPMNPLSTCFP